MVWFVGTYRFRAMWAAVKSVDSPTASEWQQGVHTRVHVSVDAMNVALEDESLVSWVRVDDGPYHPLFQGREITIVDPLLDRPGLHEITIHAAVANAPLSRDPEGIVLSVYTEILSDPLAVLVEADALTALPEVEGPVQQRALPHATAFDEQGQLFSCDAVPSNDILLFTWAALLLLMRRRKLRPNSPG